MEKPPAEPPQPPPERDDVKVNAHRCPYCHDDVAAADGVVCRDCLTRHHPACWDEAAKCSSCGSTTRLATERPPLTDALITEALTARGYSEAEVAAHLAHRPQQFPCAAANCSARPDWLLGKLPFCEEHAKESQRNRVLLHAGLAALLTVLSGVMGVGAVVEDSAMAVPGILFLVLAVGLAIGAVRARRDQPRPRDR